MPENPKINKQYNIENINTAHFHHYGDKKIKHLLTEPPFIPELFLGRDADLQHIHDRLFAPQGHLLLLVNGEGGIGKSSLASQYLHTYHQEYAHVAWVFSERSIATALLQLAIPLDLQFDERANTFQRLQVLIPALFELNKPCLLIIDNANELEDLRQYLPHLQRCSNFHILFTTRISNFPQLASYKIEPLPQDQALQVFKAHYPAFAPQEETLFYEIYTAVQGNTLVLELLAKNLRNFNNQLKKTYLLADLRRDLEQGLLQLSKSNPVDVRYQAQGTGLRHEKIEVIIAAMYDLGELSAAETQALSIFAVLPTESIPFDRLEALNLGLEGLDNTLLTLAQKGWLDFNEKAKAFKCSPVIQEVVRLKNENLLRDCRGVIDGLVDKLEYEGAIGHLLNSTYTEAILWAHWAAVLLIAPFGADSSLGLLCERLGTYHKATGNLAQALTCFEKYNILTKELHEAYPKNPDFKNLLAISYSKLGSMHTALGNLPQALVFFQHYTCIAKELNTAYPENMEFKKGLATSYQFLGNTHRTSGNLPQALIFFQQFHQLAKELYAAFPEDVDFINGLAIAYEKLGETHTTLGNLPQASTFFEIEAKLFELLLEAYPENVSFKNGLAISYQFLGNTHTALSNLPQALTFFEQYTSIAKELHAAYPENVEFKNNLAISYSKIGSTHTAIGNLPQALIFFEQFNQLAKELHAAYPENVVFKSNLAISYSKLGSTQSSLGNLAQALTFFEQYNTLRKELYASYPENVSFKNSLALSYQWLGSFLEQKMQNPEKAQEHFQASRALLEDLVAKSPDHVEFKKNLDWVKSKLKL